VDVEPVRSMIESLRQTPYPALLGGVAFGAVALQLLARVVALRDRRRGASGPGSAAVRNSAAAALVGPVVVAGFSVHEARALITNAFATANPAVRADEISRGISGQLNVIPFVLSTTTLGVTLWLVARSIASDTRPPALPARRVPPAALVGLGLVSIAVGGLQWSISMIQSFAALAGKDPETKPATLLRDLDFARRHLELFARMSRWTIVGLGVLAIVLTFASAGDARAVASAPRNRRLSVITIGALLAALALWAAARPLKAENDLPWPTFSPAGDVLMATEPAPPDLTGPDMLHRAPVIQIFADRLLLDGFEVSLEPSETSFRTLGDMLGTLRINFQLLRPGTPFDGVAVIVVGRQSPPARLTSVLRAVHGADYTHPIFAFPRKESTVRPAFGTLTRILATGAQVTLAGPYDEAAGGEDILRPESFADFDALARRLVALRQSGHAVTVKLKE